MTMKSFLAILILKGTGLALAGRRYNLPWWHPKIQHVADNRIPGPSNHPHLDDDPDFQDFIWSHTDDGHRFFDGRNGYIQKPWRIPGDHPKLDKFFQHEEAPIFPTAYFDHPDVEKAYFDGKSLPEDHPSVSGMLKYMVPEDHPDIDELFGDPEDLPDWHPSISLMLNVEQSPPTISVFGGHPNLKTEYTVGNAVEDHPSIHHVFEKLIPASHPNIDDLMREGYTLPSFHPDITSLIEPRDLATSPASILSYAIASFVVLIFVLQRCRKCSSTKTVAVPYIDGVSSGFTREGCLKGIDSTDATAVSMMDTVTTNDNSSESAVSSGGSTTSNETSIVVSTAGKDDEVEVESVSEFLKGAQCDGDLPSLDKRLHDALELNREHHDENLSPKKEQVRSSIIAYKEKKNSTLRYQWMSFFGERVSNWSIGELALCLMYILVNVAALMCSSSYALDVGFGSLSAGNTLFLVATATKNSIFTWCIGITFEQMLVYHRLIGRVTVLTALVHSAFYVDRIFQNVQDKVVITGLISLGCGVVIFVTSFNWVRRKFFNWFFWSHFSFIGFIGALYLHATGARPYMIVSIVCYGIDKLLKFIWTQLPRRTLKFEKVGERTAHVQFPKTPLVSLLGRHKVGQYVMVNFPELSLKEWHPFSVASSPDDPNIDLYIRGLGNHTKKIVEFSQKCSAKNKQTTIRCDGPYGDLSFNYRRYGALVLCGGGIGITPLIGILKDIYRVEELQNETKKTTAHCIKYVSVIWIMPHLSEAELFLDLLNQFHQMSLEHPHMPTLKLSIHITREHRDKHPIAVFSKPNFNLVMDEIVEDKHESLRSVLVYACGPGGMVNQLWDASMKNNSKKIRIDFYHESFEF